MSTKKKKHLLTRNQTGCDFLSWERSTSPGVLECLQTVSTSPRLFTLHLSSWTAHRFQAFNSNSSDSCHTARWRARSSFIQELYDYCRTERSRHGFCASIQKEKRCKACDVHAAGIFESGHHMTQSCFESLFPLCLTKLHPSHFSKLCCSNIFIGIKNSLN